jgi:glycosyltransferase involved in cell wall biosynthesis
MTTSFFSVIVPVFNRAPVLGAALQSVLAQSCQDFEIIVVDDGSSDNPRAVVETIGDPRIRYLRQENQGGGTARNTGINAAKGRFIAPLDSDDVFLPHHLESMKALLDGTRGIVGYARILVDRGDGRTLLKPPRAIRAAEDMGEYVLCERGFVPTITTVVEREMAQRVRYHPKLRAAEDVDFAIRLALEGCKFQMLEQPGAIWNDHDDPGRASARNRAEEFGAWLAQMRPLLTASAWHGGRGWPYARMLAHNGRKLEALRLYLTALRHRCYRPRLAAIIFLQIFLNAKNYRTLADAGIGWFRMGLRQPPPREQVSSKPFRTA